MSDFLFSLLNTIGVFVTVLFLMIVVGLTVDDLTDDDTLDLGLTDEWEKPP